MANTKDDGTARSNADLSPKVEKLKGLRPAPDVTLNQANENADQRAARRERQTDFQNDEEDRRVAAANANGVKTINGHPAAVEHTITRDHPVKPRIERMAAQQRSSGDKDNPNSLAAEDLRQ
jgi:hypothetical protein